MTAASISWNETADNELIYTVGNEEPIGNKQNTRKYSGKFSMQVGELELILLAAGLKSAIQIPNATLSIVAVNNAFSKTFAGICINTSATDIKAKDKESIVNLDWTAISVQ